MAERQTIRVDVRELTDRLPKYLDEVAQRQLPFAQARTLTEIGKLIKKNIQEEMQRRLDRPTSWIIRGVYMTFATKKKLFTEVGFQDGLASGKNIGATASQIMGPRVYGEGRNMKGFEKLLRAKGVLPAGRFVVPTKDTPLDSHGNIQNGWLTKLLAELQAFRELGYRANATDGSRARRKKQGTYAAYSYFTPGAGNEKSNGRARTGQARLLFERKEGSPPKAVLAFVKKQPKYAKQRLRFPFFELAQKKFLKEWDEIFPRMMEQAIATAHEKSARRMEAFPLRRPK